MSIYECMRWVSCSQREHGQVGSVAHLANPGGLLTACGASASHADIWRGDSRKPKCPACSSLLGGAA